MRERWLAESLAAFVEHSNTSPCDVIPRSQIVSILF